jgi:hypothetical protein
MTPMDPDNDAGCVRLSDGAMLVQYAPASVG